MAGSQQPLTQEQKQFLQLARILEQQMSDEIRISVVGAAGAGLLALTAYLIWRRP